MRVAIVGCGLIGHKRAKALGASRLAAVADLNPSRAAALAALHPGCEVEEQWERCVTRPDVDAVVISTTNDALAALTLKAVEAGKHVVVEKPAGRKAAELIPVRDAARRRGVVVKVGFNHRFHPAFLQAREIVDRGELGPLLYIRARYGHGGRVGYEQEWRAKPELSGGGELLDQGVHLIDLSRWFLGEFTSVEGSIDTFFWNMSVEDNGFLALRTQQGQLAWLHASCTEWKNLFCFEIFGRDGKLQIDGLGGSYGIERLSFYKMLPQMGPPDTVIWEYPGEDRSWQREWEHFTRCVAHGGDECGGVQDGIAALSVVEEIYRRSAGQSLAYRRKAS